MHDTYEDIVAIANRLSEIEAKAALAFKASRDRIAAVEAGTCTDDLHRAADGLWSELKASLIAPTNPVVSWWDENGAPRFGAHHPTRCPDIYADEVVLLRIACQACEREFLVQVSQSHMDVALQMATAGGHGSIATALEEALGAWQRLLCPLGGEDDGPEGKRIAELHQLLTDARARRPRSLADQVRDGSIHYGDPPNVECCAAGPTMNCLDLAVVEFWTRKLETGPLDKALESYQWRREPELERVLPDSQTRTVDDY